MLSEVSRAWPPVCVCSWRGYDMLSEVPRAWLPVCVCSWRGYDMLSEVPRAWPPVCVCSWRGYDMLSEVPRAWPPVCVCSWRGMICFLKCHVHGHLCVCVQLEGVDMLSLQTNSLLHILNLKTANEAILHIMCIVSINSYTIDLYPLGCNGG